MAMCIKFEENDIIQQKNKWKNNFPNSVKRLTFFFEREVDISIYKFYSKQMHEYIDNVFSCPYSNKKLRTTLLRYISLWKMNGHVNVSE